MGSSPVTFPPPQESEHVLHVRGLTFSVTYPPPPEQAVHVPRGLTFRVTYPPPHQAVHAVYGVLDVRRREALVRADTLLVATLEHEVTVRYSWLVETIRVPH